MDEIQRRDSARRIVAAKLGFIRHATVYILVMVGLALINNFTSPGYQWWLWGSFGWGVAVVAHFVSAFVFRSGALQSRLIQREMDKLDE